MNDNRRDFLKKSALLSLSGLASSLIGRERIDSVEQMTETFYSSKNNFVLPALPYAYNAMEPWIDAKTMEIHHTKHHQAYIDKLNSATSKKDKIDMELSDEDKCRQVDANTSDLVRNNLGGYYNHSLFWTLLKANPQAKDNRPVGGKLAEAITRDFKFLEDLKEAFNDKAGKIFGSGWCWLIADEKGNLKITTTPNQDNPLMKVAAEQGRPILALDIWEHAYYLKYQNRRAEYIQNWWNLVNWEKAEELYNKK